jgi:thioesterase domain-containing protein
MGQTASQGATRHHSGSEPINEVQVTPVEPCVPIHFQLLAIWERLLACKIDSVTANFLELGGNRGLAIAMLKEVARECGPTLSLDAFLAQPTVAALADAMLDLQNHQGVVEIQRGTNDVPFIYFHGDILGGGFYTRSLARQLGPDRPVYVFPPPPLSRDSNTTIEEIAARRCQEIRRLRPHGPYIIGGFCISALVAYEVARQLVEAGEEVQSVVLVDPELPNRLERICLRVIERFSRGRGDRQKAIHRFTAVNQKLSRLQFVWHSPLRDKIEFVLGNLGKLFRRRRAVQEPHNEVAMPDVTRDGWRVDVFQWIATSYELKPYAGRVAILMTEEQQRGRPSLARTWSRMAAELNVQILPGRHMTAITTRQATLAARIKSELQAAQSMIAMGMSGLAMA